MLKYTYATETLSIIVRSWLAGRRWCYRQLWVSIASKVQAGSYARMYLHREMRHGICGRSRIEEQRVEHSAYIYSRRRFLRSSSRSVTVPSTILLLSNSDSGNGLKGRRGGKLCCIRLTSESV